VRLNHKTKLPISIKYKTPDTLGADRVANAVASNDRFPNDHVLAIDAGTCIKYDLVDDNQCYHGGAISPGLTMRFKALNTFTDKLPLVQRSDQGMWLGQTTEESIQTGVEHGAVQEVKGFIESYEKEFPNLKVILTGGDASFFESRLKKQIFATRIISGRVEPRGSDVGAQPVVSGESGLVGRFGCAVSEAEFQRHSGAGSEAAG
jgi:type III pantothenate kinase